MKKYDTDWWIAEMRKDLAGAIRYLAAETFEFPVTREDAVEAVYGLEEILADLLERRRLPCLSR